MLRKKDCCGCGDWKSQIRELWEKYQSVVKGLKAGDDTVYPDGDGIADIDGAIENEVARQISDESLVTQTDLSEAIADFATVDQLDTGLATVAAAKQDRLVNQINIKSINGVSLLGSGDMQVPASIAWDDVTDKPEFAEVATSGSYDDLTDKPTIPEAQVNSDWEAVSGVAQILNKPTFATVATSGSYDDLTNKPTIPAAQVNSDWDAVSGVAQILNKPTIPSGTDLVPSTSGITDGYVLTNDNGTPAWKAGGGGGGGASIHTYSTFGAFAADLIAHPGAVVEIIGDDQYDFYIGGVIPGSNNVIIRCQRMTSTSFGSGLVNCYTSSTSTTKTITCNSIDFDTVNSTFAATSYTASLPISRISMVY